MERDLQFEAQNPDLRFVGLDKDNLGLWYRDKQVGNPVFFDGTLKFEFSASRFYHLITDKLEGKKVDLTSTEQKIMEKFFLDLKDITLDYVSVTGLLGVDSTRMVLEMFLHYRIGEQDKNYYSSNIKNWDF